MSTLCFIQQHDGHVTDKCPYVVGPLALGVSAKLPELAARWRLYGAAVHTFFASLYLRACLVGLGQRPFGQS